MIPALRNLHRLRVTTSHHAVNQPMLMVDPARPPARQIAAERFGFAGALERMAAAFLDQRVQLVEQFGIARPEVDIFSPGAR